MSEAGPPEVTTGEHDGPVPRVSVGMPVYNGEDFLEETLGTILAQSFTDFELIISDNASSDRTEEICSAAVWQDPRVRYFRHPVNLGAAANYNFALHKARAAYFKWAAHDDLLAPTFLERCVEVMDAAPPSVVLVYPRSLIVNAKSKVIGDYDNKLDLRDGRPSARLYHLIRNLTLSNPLFGLLRKDALLRTRIHGTYNEADRVMLAELALEGQFWEFPDPLFLRRMHANVSTAASKSVRDIAVWFDPQNRRRLLLFPRLRLFGEHLRAITRAELPLGERLLCTGAYLLSSLQRMPKNRRIRQAHKKRQKAAREQSKQPGATEPASGPLEQALAAQRAGRLEEAIGLYDAILEQQPNSSDAMHLKGIALAQSGRRDAAVALLQRAFEARPDRQVSEAQLLAALSEVGAVQESDANTPRVTAAAEPALQAWGMALLRMKRYREALICFERALEADPESVEGLYHKGITLFRLDRLEESVVWLKAACARQPETAMLQGKLGNAYSALGDREAAAACYRKVLEIEPENADALGNLVMATRLLCDWRDHAALFERLRRACGRAVQGKLPNPINASFAQNLPFNPAELAALSRRHAETLFAPLAPLRQSLRRAQRRTRRSDGRLRIGYLSEGFRNFPTGHLIQGLFAQHDRQDFEILAYSYGPDDGSPHRKRIAETVDQFVDIREVSDGEAARRIQQDRIDILLDLKGYTINARPQIAALRPAPLQVNYLGFPGTWGCDAMDYILVDPIVVSEADAPHFSERFVTLPHCYQVTDDQQAIAAETPSRAEHGLPETGFVFCCFNRIFKIEPPVFDVWMAILRELPESVLWLMGGEAAAEANLRATAAAGGVAPERLVFARSIAKPQHLARHRLADLFLDSYSYNAHTTGTDALWAGLPIITLPGRTFQARVAASLLTNVGLPELIVGNPQDYAKLAIGLARDPDALRRVTEKLARNRANCPLFDTARFARGLEAAYRRMWALHEAGEAPRPITIDERDLAA